MSSINMALQPTIPWTKIGWCFLALGGIAAGLNAVLFTLIPAFDGGSYDGVASQKDRMFDIAVIGFTHTMGGAMAAFIGPFQFLSSVRRKFPLVHRWLGRFYLSCVFLSALGGLYIAPNSEARNTLGIAFICLALAWLYTGAQAYLTIRKRQVAAHKRWMIRNYALTYAAVTLRIEMPLFILAFGFTPLMAMNIVGWLCWVANLLIVEWWMRRRNNINANANKQ